MKARRPSIIEIGRCVDNGTTVSVTGWTLGLCLAQCLCHRRPGDGQLAVTQDQDTGALGLESFLPAGLSCSCCEPWTAQELLDVVQYVEHINAIPTVEAPTEKEGQA